MYDVLMAVAFMSFVFGLAASILLVADRLSIRSKKSEEERTAILSAREGRWIRRYGFFMLVMAAISLVTAALGNNKDEPIGLRIFYIVFAAAFIIFYVASR